MFLSETLWTVSRLTNQPSTTSQILLAVLSCQTREITLRPSSTSRIRLVVSLILVHSLTFFAGLDLPEFRFSADSDTVRDMSRSATSANNVTRAYTTPKRHARRCSWGEWADSQWYISTIYTWYSRRYTTENTWQKTNREQTSQQENCAIAKMTARCALYK